MRFLLHPKVHSDVDAIMDYYERVASQELADDFYAELRQLISYAAEQPNAFSIRQRDLRRVNLHRFPYHFLFRIVGSTARTSLFDTIGGILHSASPIDGPVPDSALQRAAGERPPFLSGLFPRRH